MDILQALESEQKKKDFVAFKKNDCIHPSVLQSSLKALGCDSETIDDVMFLYDTEKWPEIIKYFETKYDRH